MNYANASSNRQSARHIWRLYLASMEWTYLCHLTFENPVSANTGWKKTHQWIKRIRAEHNAKITWWAVQEFGFEKERHVHALLNVTPRVPINQLRSQWSSGFSKVDKFDAMKHGIFYITKTLDDDDTEYDFELQHP